MIALHFPVAIGFFAVGIYCLLFRRNLIKMVIGLELLTDGIHVFLVSLGFGSESGTPIAPILTGEILSGEFFEEFMSQSVDPIPQVLVLTSIVIDIAIVALALSLVILLYRKYGTLNPKKIRGLKG